MGGGEFSRIGVPLLQGRGADISETHLRTNNPRSLTEMLRPLEGGGGGGGLRI